MTMPLLERSFASTLDALVAEFATKPGARLEAWVFADAASRRAAEAELKAKGVEARIRSAFKPLVHAFLEEIAIGEIASARVAYPQHPGCTATRFLVEAYPLSGLLPEAEVGFTAGTETPFTYELSLTDTHGRTEEVRVFAPNREHTDAVGEPQVSPTGWVRATFADGTSRDERLETDVERLFEAAVAAAAEWEPPQGTFTQLRIAATLPWPDRALGIDDEAIRYGEILHEDLYFSLLEVFQTHSGLSLGDRTLQPGQIAPAIAIAPGAPQVRVSVRALSNVDADGPAQDLANPQAPLPPTQIAAELAKIGGMEFSTSTVSGRTVAARYLAGGDAGVMISGGQHANEPSGIVGALCAAQTLAERDGAHFTVHPLENPDGYALYRELIALSPGQMLHGARYTALGDDLEYRATEPRYESAIRDRARELCTPNFHINLHGYPAHEWSRPFTGYVPRGFAMWMLPRGLFFILRHHSAWSGAAERLIDKVTRRVGAALPEVLELTARQRRLSHLHAGEPGTRIVNGFCCQISVDDAMPTPLKLTTEYPDESLRGPAFALACEAQAEVTLAAYDAYQKIVG
jgi:hypothetical protein